MRNLSSGFVLERHLKRKNHSLISVTSRNPCQQALIDIEKEEPEMYSLLLEPEMYKHRKYNTGGSDRIGIAENDDGAVDYEDPDFRLFFQSLRPCGNSYALVVYPNNDEPQLLPYELSREIHKGAENFAANRDSKGKKRKSREASGCGKPEISRGRGRKRNEEKGIEDIWDDVPIGRRRDFLVAEKACGGTRWGSKSNYDASHKEDHEDGEDLEYGKLVDFDSSDGDRFVLSEYNKGNGNSEVDKEYSRFADREFNRLDKAYASFLDHLGMEGGDKFIGAKEQSESESDSDSDLVVLDKDDLELDGHCTAVVSTRPSRPIKVGSNFLEKHRSASRSQFKKQLIEVLKKPYDLKEYQDLKYEVELRRPALEDVDRRGKTRTCSRPKLKLGKSYLALHSDFAKLVELAKNNKRRSLNLLRGFFFWLKNIAHDESFRPWHYPKILEVLPKK